MPKIAMANSTDRQKSLNDRSIKHFHFAASKENQHPVLKDRSPEQPNQQQIKRQSRFPAKQSPKPPVGFETDPAFIKSIWEDVQNYLTLTTVTMKTKSELPSTLPAKGSASYNRTTLKPRRIQIFENRDVNDKYSELDNTPTRYNLGPFYVDYNDPKFLERLVLMAKSYENRENEAEWESQIYSKILREHITPQGKTKPHLSSERQDLDFIDIGLQRKLKPIISLTSRDGKILLPPEQKDKQKSRQSANNFPPPIEGTEKEIPESRRSIIPDMIFAPRAYPCSEDAFIPGKRFPAIRNFSDHNVYPPYLLVESKPVAAQETEAKQPTALLAAMLLLERLKLRVMFNNIKYDDLCIFVITCCGPCIKIWKMSFDSKERDLDCIIGYKMHPIGEYDITEISFLKALCQRINNIHLFGLTTYKSSVLADLNACCNDEVQFDPEYIDLRSLRLNKPDAGTTAVLEIGEEIADPSEIASDIPGDPSGVPLEPRPLNQQGNSNRKRSLSSKPPDDLKKRPGRPRKKLKINNDIAGPPQLVSDIPGDFLNTLLEPRSLNQQGNSNKTARCFLEPPRPFKETRARTSQKRAKTE
ncbi:MAG: hypothetical protein Q9187_007743 [Circinaria calcarea]